MSIREVESSWLEHETGILRTLRAAADRLERHVVPIFHGSDEGTLQPAGSGVLVRLGSRAYLVSAAHVLDHCEFGVFVPKTTHLVEPLENTPILTGLRAGASRDDDRVDVGFVRLTTAEKEDFNERLLDLDVVSGPPMPIATTFFVALGFALKSHTANRSTKTIQSQITCFMTGLAEESVYERAHVDPRSHILLRFDQRSVATKSGRGSLPDMKGISGGGVWPVRVDLSDSVAQIPLFGGIVIERPSLHRSSLAVTRGTLIRHFIERFDVAAQRAAAEECGNDVG